LANLASASHDHRVFWLCTTAKLPKVFHLEDSLLEAATIRVPEVLPLCFFAPLLSKRSLSQCGCPLFGRRLTTPVWSGRTIHVLSVRARLTRASKDWMILVAHSTGFPSLVGPAVFSTTLGSTFGGQPPMWYAFPLRD